MIYELFKKSWSDIDKRLFVPIILQNLILILLVTGFLYFNGLMTYFMDSFGGKQVDPKILLNLFYPLNLKFMASGIVLAILILVINSSFAAMRLALTKSIVQGKPMTTNEMFSHGRLDLGRVIMLRIYNLLIVLFATAVIVLAAVLASFASTIAMNIVIIVLGIIAVILIGLGLFFSYAIMFVMDTPPWNAVKKSFKCFLSKPGLIFLAFLMLILAAIPSGLIGIVDLLNIKILASAVYVLRILYGLFLEAWNDIFIFNVYNSNKNF